MDKKFKVRQRVYGRRWPHRSGIIKKVTKTSVHVHYPDLDDTLVYDIPHTKFLEVIKG